MPQIQTLKTNFKKNDFDIIVASDILEHCKDDEKAILEWNRILKPNGHMLLFVPAFNFLWSEHDIKNKHYRRYTYPVLKEILENNGFEIVQFSFWNFFTFFPKYIMALFNTSKKNGDDVYILPNRINQILSKIIKLENKIIMNGKKIPFGVSIFIFAKKKTQARA